ncbi:hypothetical protein SJPD1_1983 [Sulfurospirillum diekertiae]|uniref:Pseudopilin domain-containing protein n=1 Tax=Sulfurospirillum diekertiae TaxID=1854492 RepID=A0A290HQV8_9BACT|nr:type II secretion system protein [Sulfurospirillum diekertiae]ATB70088.1 hypothetical protein SJPD1_1983 [Sulfurospirillum diekertiae]
MKLAFTMIELVFVIVILGILGAVAFPKMAPFIEDAKMARGQSNVAAIRSAISNERGKNMLNGVVAFPQILDDAAKDTSGESLFDGNATVSILQYPLYSKASGGFWMKKSDNGATTQYRYYLSDSRYVDFNYTRATGNFDCAHNAANDNDCANLTK